MSDIIETPRLVLRRPHPDDAPVIASHLDNIEITGKLSRVPHPYGLSDAVWWLNTQQGVLAPGETNFAITLDGQVIGVVGFHPDAPGTTLGYWLGAPYWGRGYMSEAAFAALGWYFRLTDVQVVYSGAFDFNAASLAIQNKLGFTQLGVSTRHCLARGLDLRHIDTLLTRAAWTERQTR